MLWVKAFHIIFVVSWFAALFYLPRLFVYHARANDEISLQRFQVMEKRLYVLGHIASGLAFFFGGWLLAMLCADNPRYLAQPWLHAKLSCVVLLFGYFLWCGRIIKQFGAGQNRRSANWFRYFNEVPSLLLIAIILLVVLQPRVN
jgi:protoporphyrinogen IX oxidase